MDIKISPEDAGVVDGKSLWVGSHGYVQLYLNGQMALLHRTLLGLKKGDGLIGDHKNGDTMDYRRSNLRAVSPSGSSSNVVRHSASGIRGVYRYGRRWQARAHRTYLGTFDSAEAASAAVKAHLTATVPEYVDRTA